MMSDPTTASCQNKDSSDNDNNNENDSESLVHAFDTLCLTDGDVDVIRLATGESVCRLELQELSWLLASQLRHRYRPDVVLLDVYGHVVAEAVALLACARLRIPVCPVRVHDEHAAVERMRRVVQTCQQYTPCRTNTTSSTRTAAHVVAICGASNDQDPALGVFYRAGVHSILYLDRLGNVRQQIVVPRIPWMTSMPPPNDDLYILFTSGTSSPIPKAVVGSHRSTFRRIQWFTQHWVPPRTTTSPWRMGRKTRLTFVDGITELWTALLVSTPYPQESVMVAVEPDVWQTQGLEGLCRTMRPTQLTLIPTQLAQLLFLPSSCIHDCMKGVWQCIIVSGEPCPAWLVDKFLQIFAASSNSCQLINLYGQTESTGDVLCAVLTDLSPAQRVCRGVVAVGKPILDSIQIALSPETKDNNNENSNQQEIIVRGNLANGYITLDDDNNNNNNNNNVDQRRQPFVEFATGDTGFCQDGIWYVTGRCNDVAKINGQWTSPAQVETAFRQHYCHHHYRTTNTDSSSSSSQQQQPQQQPIMIAAVIYEQRVYVISEQPVPDFSREAMHQAGIPWNLIPHRVLVHSKLPVSQTGAGKVNRAALGPLVRQLLLRKEKEHDSLEITAAADSMAGTTNPTLESILTEILGQPPRPDKSFVDMGGDSASSIHLLYRLRQADLISNTELNAMHLLRAENIDEMKALLTKKEADVTKRRRLNEDANQVKREPSATMNFSTPKFKGFSEEGHGVIPFHACVDASPTLMCCDDCFYMGCQGGLVCRIEAGTGQVLDFRGFHQIKFGAEVLEVVHSQQICLCGEREDGSGWIALLDKSLKTILWESNLERGISRVPIVIQRESRYEIWVRSGCHLVIFNSVNGTIIHQELLSSESFGRPVLKGKEVWYSGTTLSKVTFTDTDLQVKEYDELSESIGPCFKDVLAWGTNDCLVICDSWGQLHIFDTKLGKVRRTVYVASCPLSSPVIVGENELYVGCYDGRLFKFKYNQEDDQEPIIQWKVNVGASVYTRPLIISDDDTALFCMVCTTAGDVVVVRNKDGYELKRFRINGEIWSDPQLIHETSSNFTVAFGARDSHAHLLKIERKDLRPKP